MRDFPALFWKVKGSFHDYIQHQIINIVDDDDENVHINVVSKK